MKLSIVATLYQSEAYVVEFCDRSAAVAKTLTGDYEIVLVNDGATDGSLEVAKRYADSHANIKIVDLSRNFGHHKAMMAGLAHAQGDLVFLIDSDLEEEPEWLSRFWELLQSERVDVVYGVQSRRRGGLLNRLSGYLYYTIFRAFTGLSIPFNLVTARLMTRRYVDALLSFEEREIDIAGLWVIAGFDQRPFTVTKHESSDTTYTLEHKLRLLVDSLTSFSSVPLVAIFYFGFAVSSVAFVFTVYLFIKRFFLLTPLDGWTSVMASIWLLGGLIILFIGTIGIYLAKVFSETKRRPNTIVREIYTSSQTAGSTIEGRSDDD